jgi:hypothetical protein
MSPIGTTKVTRINNNKGKTKRKALILFIRSAFFKLTYKGNPSVVKICSVVEIKTSN